MSPYRGDQIILMLQNLLRSLCCWCPDREDTSNDDELWILEWCMMNDEVLFRKVISRHPSLVNVRNKYGYTFLILQSMRRRPNMRIVRYILSSPCLDVNIGDNGGYTPLYYMVKNNNIEGARRLLLYPDIDVNSTTRMGNTILTIASLYGYMEIVVMLLYHPRIQVSNTYVRVRHPRIRDIIRSHCNSLYSRRDRSPTWMSSSYSDIDIICTTYTNNR